MEPSPHRIVVIGTSGAGKSTFAGRLAGTLGIPHVELDSLFWEPDWVAASPEVFHERVADALSADSWVVDGNYGKIRDTLWRAGGTLIWLDYPLHVVFRRSLGRALKRAFTREILWSGNRESWRRTFFSRESILLWVLKSHDRKKREYDEFLTLPEYAHLAVIRFRSPAEAEVYLTGLKEPVSR